jgi:hypothetical protein
MKTELISLEIRQQILEGRGFLFVNFQSAFTFPTSNASIGACLAPIYFDFPQFSAPRFLHVQAYQAVTHTLVKSTAFYQPDHSLSLRYQAKKIDLNSVA